MSKYTTYKGESDGDVYYKWVLRDGSGKPIALHRREGAYTRKGHLKTVKECHRDIRKIKDNIDEYGVQWCCKFVANNGVTMAVTEWKKFSGNIGKDLAFIKKQMKDADIAD